VGAGGSDTVSWSKILSSPHSSIQLIPIDFLCLISLKASRERVVYVFFVSQIRCLMFLEGVSPAVFFK
jgi:hypothetical protein